jgi:hypothetical protein
MTEAICFAITQYEEQGFIDIDSHERIEEAMKKQALEDE